MVGQLDHKILVSLSLFRALLNLYPNRLTDAFEEHGMTVVKSTAIQLATAEHEVELNELRNERATARTDATRKWKLQASFYCSTNMAVHIFDPFEALLFCNCLRIILMFFNFVKGCEVKKCKIVKDMEPGLYRQPIINFQETKLKVISRECM